MRNAFETRGETVAIFLGGRYRTSRRAETLIDLVDFALVSAPDVTWTVFENQPGGNLYVHYQDGGQSVSLSRLLMRPPDGFVVDHINHDTLNNRRVNLRVVTEMQNQHNRRGPNRNGTTGVLGVTFDRRRKSPWRAHVRFDGERRSRYFASLEEAKAQAEAWHVEAIEHGPARGAIELPGFEES